MPEKKVDLHGSAPGKHKVALLLIDVINDFDTVLRLTSTFNSR
ncbi:MAG TPA: hypothetical protein VF899_21620 [Pyrinomonadaceae bacterium]